jgi:hypothetical protein
VHCGVAVTQVPALSQVPVPAGVAQAAPAGAACAAQTPAMQAETRHGLAGAAQSVALAHMGGRGVGEG